MVVRLASFCGVRDMSRWGRASRIALGGNGKCGGIVGVEEYFYTALIGLYLRI
jgi:hypothetical protein